MNAPHEKKSEAQTVVRQLKGFLCEWPWAIPLLGALGLAASLSEGIGIGLLIPFLYAATGESGLDKGGMLGNFLHWLPPERRMLFVGLSIVALVGARTAILYANVVVSNWLNGCVSRDLRRKMFRKVLDLGHPYIASRPSGELLNIMDTQMWRVSDAFSYLFAYIVAICTVVVFGVMLLALSWRLTLVIAAAVLVTAAIVRLLSRRVKGLSDRALASNGEILDRLVETLGGARTITAFGSEARERTRFEGATERLRYAFFRLELATGLVPPLVEFLYTPLLVGAVIIAVHWDIPLPVLVAFLLLVYRLQPYAKNVEHSRVQLSSASAAVASVCDLLEQEPRVSSSGTLPFTELRQAVTFEHVGFHYPSELVEGPPAVHDVSFELRRGEVTALVGGSGAGKSTLLYLLLRFYEPTDGLIWVDGARLVDLDLAAWRRRIGLAGQDAELLSGTIAENIAYGAPDDGADRDAMMDAAKRAGVDSFVNKFADGYDTQVGPRGASLSGGQRQRIGMARALLRKPEILLLDEATNALDGISETMVQQTLSELAGQTTILVIAHRLSTIQHANQVVVLDHGRVVERGSAAELARSSGEFSRLYARDMPSDRPITP